jgi:hypothetical protein
MIRTWPYAIPKQPFIILQLNYIRYRNAYQIAGVTSFKGRLSKLFHVLSDDVAAGMREAAAPDQDEVMEAEVVASNYLEQDEAPMTPSAPHRSQHHGTPGTKRKSAEEGGSSATRTRLQF